MRGRGRPFDILVRSSYTSREIQQDGPRKSGDLRGTLKPVKNGDHTVKNLIVYDLNL